MSEIESTQADRGQAKRIVREFRQEGWPAKEEELAGLLSRIRHEARAEVLEEAAKVADTAAEEEHEDTFCWGMAVSIATAIRALRSGEREG